MSRSHPLSLNRPAHDNNKFFASDSYDFTNFRQVTGFISQSEQIGFVFNNGYGRMKHESYLVFCIRIQYPCQNR